MILFLFSFLSFLNLSMEMTLVNQYQLKNIRESYTEEIWVYFNRPIYNKDVYLFYEYNHDKVTISSASIILTVTCDELTSQIISEATAQIPLIIKRWINIAVSLDNKGNKMTCNLYIN